MFDIRDNLNPRRVTNAMWDFSWMYCHYKGGYFENFDKATDELLERGFNTVRIDAFPWIAGHLRSDDEAVTIPGDPMRNWGHSDIDHKHCPILELIEFVSMLKKKGLFVILSNWGFDCREYSSPKQNDCISDQITLRHGWERILKALSLNRLLDNILYVDIDQEFPYFGRYTRQLNDLSGEAKDKNSSSMADVMEEAGKTKNKRGLVWNEAQLDFVYRVMNEDLQHFQWLYPELRFTFSLTDFWEEVRSLKLKTIDILELHIWIHNPRFDNRTGFNVLEKDRGKHDYSDYQLRIDKTMKSIKPMLMGEMHNKMAFASAWAKEISAPLITTESWGPWWNMDHQHLKWDWLKDWCEECMNLASHYGFWGATPWNYSHPYWNNWSDVKWYRKVNEAFLKG